MNNQNFSPLKNSELVEIRISNASQTRFNFPDIPNVVKKKITAIEVFKIADIPVAPTGGNALNATAFKDGFITLHSAGKEKIKELPLIALDSQSNNGLMKNLNEMVIEPQKCYLSFSRTTNLVANEVLLLAVYFED
jgi:hypothetical protein